VNWTKLFHEEVAKLHYTAWRNSNAEIIYVFIYGLFNDAIIIIDHIASNDMTVKNGIGKNMERSDHHLR
jgi:hypothetical protein